MILGALAVAGCGRTGPLGSPELPDGWEGATPRSLIQSPCGSPAGPGAETLEVGVWDTPMAVNYRRAHFRCAQKLCAFTRQDGDTLRALVQPCDMEPIAMAACDCTYEVSLAVPVSGTVRVVELHRRWDNQTPANFPRLVGRAERSPSAGSSP